MKKAIFLAIILLCINSCEPALGKVAFNDLNLEAAVCLKINKPWGNIYIEDVKEITDISLIGHFLNGQIKDITGLQYFTSLTELNLAYNQISDLSHLSGLNELKQLFLNSNPLNNKAINTIIPALINKGVWVH